MTLNAECALCALESHAGKPGGKRLGCVRVQIIQIGSTLPEGYQLQAAVESAEVMPPPGEAVH